MFLSKQIDLWGEKITVNELTVKEVREFFSQIGDDTELDFLDELIDGYLPMSIVTQSSGVTIDQMNAAYPSEVQKLAEAVADINPHLASTIKKRVEAYQSILQK